MTQRTHIGRGRIAATTLAVTGVAVLAAGCGSSSSKGGSAQNPAASIKRAAYVSAGEPGYKVEMALSEAISGQSSGQKTITATAHGAFSPSARMGDVTMKMRLPVSGPLHDLELRVVLDRGTIYMRLPAALASKVPGGKTWLSMNLAQMGKASGIPGIGSLVNSSS